ncbi:MAG: cell division protein ZapA [Faecalibacterium sp.]
MTTKVRVNIAGSNYTITTTDTEAYVASLAEKLNQDIENLLEVNQSLSVTRASVFCALDYLDEYRKSAQNADNMRAQIKDYLEDAAKAKLAAEEARREVERLRREVQYLKEDKR